MKKLYIYICISIYSYFFLFKGHSVLKARTARGSILQGAMPVTGLQGTVAFLGGPPFATPGQYARRVAAFATGIQVCNFD